MNIKTYVKKSKSGKILLEARIFKICTRKYAFDTRKPGKDYLINLKMPFFEFEDDAEGWILKQNGWEERKD